MEQLKERYYDMCRLLLASRAASLPDGGDKAAAEEHPLAKFRFEAAHELERKAEFERQYARTDAEVVEEVKKLEHSKALEAKLRAQKKQQAKPGGRAAGLAALKASLSANGLGSAADSLSGLKDLPSLAGIMEGDKKHRNADVWLRSKDVSNKRPASERNAQPFEERMKGFHMPIRPMPTEVNIDLYNQCRAHVVLLVELEAKIEKLEQDRQFLLQRNQPSMPPPQANVHHGGGQKRAHPGGGQSGGQKRSHH